jgi:phage protein D
MATLQLFVDGSAVDAGFLASLSRLEVEENLELPSAIELQIPVTRQDDGELGIVGDARFRPFANIAVVIKAEGQSAQCIFDGVVLSHRVHLTSGTAGSSVAVWGEDASWLMNLEEKVKEWTDVTDASVANTIFGDYGIEPAGANMQGDSAMHTESGHTLMQRGSDIQFLRTLARRNGKLCWVASKSAPGERVGFFIKPDVESAPVATLTPFNDEDGNVDALDFEWNVAAPSAVVARQATFTDAGEDGAGVEAEESGIAPLAARDLATFAGKPMTMLLATTVDDQGELKMRAESLLRESGWFVRCRGETQLVRLNKVLRPGNVVSVTRAGATHSGRYFVWSVRHTITTDAHRMQFVLVRNAVGGG